ncbi:hypothetical protein [Pontibacter sp. H249]|uniref:hypothetical protein n=1 Tax=Pontibacter sp. H249 TaxID=3133420 RepID=UPI0030BC5565
METNSSSAGNIDLLRQDILEKIQEVLFKEKGNHHTESLVVTKETFQKKLKAASLRYKIMRPITVAMVILFILICIAQLGDFDFFFEWQQAALFILMTFVLTQNTSSLKQQIERYKYLLYLLGILESLDELK